MWLVNKTKKEGKKERKKEERKKFFDNKEQYHVQHYLFSI
jgi:hypothetical protein